jgi:hypothetical protein
MALGKITMLGFAGAAGYLAWISRSELQRYVRIVRMDSNPALVGVSVTPQGNRAAFGHSELQREADRKRVGLDDAKPMDRSMPDMGPADQGS